MFIASIIFVITFVNLDFSAAQTKAANLPSLCCITGDRRNYKINTTFITADCKSRCVCTQDAFLGCIPLCPKPNPKCPVGFKREDDKESFVTGKGQVCDCPKYKCTPIKTAVKQANLHGSVYCVDGSKWYKPGEDFVRNCNERCRCHTTGKVRCISLCPKVKSCMVDHTAKDVLVPTPYNNGKCQCTAKACKPFPYKDKCNVNGVFYNSGVSFVSSDCSSSCQCNPGGKVFCSSLCSPQGSNCKMNEKAVSVPTKVPNSKCTCLGWKCVKSSLISVVAQVVGSNTQVKKPVIPKHQCTTTKGKVYQIGAVFSDNNCTSKCHCQNGGVLSCSSLCGKAIPPDSSCKKHKTVQVATNIPDAQGKSCTCPVVKCI